MKRRTYTFKGGGISYRVELYAHGASVVSIRDVKAGRTLFAGKKPVFTAYFTDLASGERFGVSSENSWNSVTASDGTLTFRSTEKAPGVSVVISASCTEDALEFRTQVINAEDGVSAYEISHPSLYFDKNKNTRFFYPYGSGETKPSTIKEGWNAKWSYPSYGASMQYLCFYNTATRRGVYYGLHDPAPAAKSLIVRTQVNEKAVLLKSSQILSGVKSGRNSQSLCGVCVMKAFDGDWYDAAQIYRGFVESAAEYCPEFGEHGRKGVPQWLLDTDCWFNTRVLDDGDFAEEVITQAKDLGANLAIHLYYWHQIPFDNDYPHYFPMRQNVLPGLKKLHEAGIKVMPYINGRLWDTRDRGTEDFEFTSVAKPWATKDYAGEPITEQYSSKESDGSRVTLAVMCPSATLWQDKVASIVAKLFENGFDGVYIDQIAAAEAKPCTDKRHNHPAGGGEWWCRAYNTMLERIARTKPADRALTTECTADPFMPHLDGYLTWIWIKNDQVPAFPAVFSDKVIMFGTDFRGLGNMDCGLFGALDEAGVRIFGAQSFLFGQQMGWMTPELFSRMSHRDFFIKLVRARAAVRRYFNEGRMLRPPVITDDGEKIVLTKCREAYGGYVESPCVNGAYWMHKPTGKKCLMLINSGMTDVTARVKCELPDGVYALTGDIKKKITVKNGEFSLALPPLSLAYTEV